MTKKEKHWDAVWKSQSHITARTKTEALKKAKARVKVRKS